MTEFYIAITTRDWEFVRTSLFTNDGCENAGVLLCGISKSELETRLLVRKFVPVPRKFYAHRSEYHLEVSPSFYNEIISECIRNRHTPVIIHSHPHNDEAWYSRSDDYGEGRLLPVLESLVPSSLAASLVVTPTSVTGRRLTARTFVTLSGLKIFGLTSKIAHFSSSAEKYQAPVAFNRQVLAFGEGGQQTLAGLKVGIVGVGGIGSLVAELLARVGVTDITLVDNDVVEESNLNRLLGATRKHIGQSKASVVALHLQNLGVIKRHQVIDTALKQSVLMALRDRDIIFSCVDNDRTRATLNRFSHQYLIPVVDHGTRIDGRDGRIRAAAGRVTLLGSGLACVRCSHHINADRIYAESLPPEERKSLQKEGYVIGIDDPVPAVISLNAVVAGLGTTAALNVFVDLTGGPQPVDQLYDATSGSVFAASPKHDKNCDVCGEQSGLKALGDSQIVSAYI